MLDETNGESSNPDNDPRIKALDEMPQGAPPSYVCDKIFNPDVLGKEYIPI